MKTFLKIIVAVIIVLLGVTYFGNNDESEVVKEINNKIDKINNSIEGDSLYYVSLKSKLIGFYAIRNDQLWLETRNKGDGVVLIPVIDNVPKQSMKIEVKKCDYNIDKNLLTITGIYKDVLDIKIMIKRINEKNVFFQIKSKDLNKTLEGKIVNLMK